MADKKLNIKVRTKGAKKSKKDLKGVEGGMKSLGRPPLLPVLPSLLLKV